MKVQKKKKKLGRHCESHLCKASIALHLLYLPLLDHKTKKIGHPLAGALKRYFELSDRLLVIK